jgi:hypothetical protein
MRGIIAIVPAVIFGTLAVGSDGPSKAAKAGAKMDFRAELLSETVSDTVIKEMPVVVGGKLRIGYLCHGSTGIAKASVRYRVLKKGAPKTDDGPWMAIVLAAAKPDDTTGPFNPKTGVFKNTKFDEEVPFHALAADPQAKEARVLGGGRVLLQTRGLIDATGKPVQLMPGDRIEYCIEVAEVERQGAAVKTARSPIRVAEIMTLAEFQAWFSRIRDEDRRIRELERRQKDVFPAK